MPNIFFEYARLFRLPGLGGLSMAPVFGAISLMDVGVHISLSAIVLLLLFGILKSIYGFVLNDYADIDLDRLSKDISNRPLVKGTISKKTALAICFLCIAGMFAIIFLFFYKDHPTFYYGLGCMVLAFFFGTIYNLYGKRFMSSALIAAAADALIVLVAAFIVSPDGTLSIFTWMIFLLIFMQFLFMTTVVGGIKDADHDYLLNVKNIALAIGVKITKDKKIFLPLIFKVYGLGIRFLSAFIVFVPFIFFGIYYETWQILLLALLVIIVLYLSVKLVIIKTFEPTDPHIIQLFSLQGVLRYSFVPVMLIPVIGLVYAFVLILFPIIWFIIFIPLSGKKLSQPVD
ncbi:MAG: UbiA family prenyltransferase [Thermoplasmatales archaeon]|nr:UbiA family prenyltransferase [Thermoplasmatales archaeon]